MGKAVVKQAYGEDVPNLSHISYRMHFIMLWCVTTDRDNYSFDCRSKFQYFSVIFNLAAGQTPTAKYIGDSLFKFCTGQNRRF